MKVYFVGDTLFLLARGFVADVSNGDDGVNGLIFLVAGALAVLDLVVFPLELLAGLRIKR